MEVLVHFVFQLIKIGVLSVLYTLLLRFIFYILRNVIDDFQVNFSFKYIGFIYVSLFLYSFTYYGNHGLGDGAIIPIGNRKTIENVNWEDYGYSNQIKRRDGKTLEVKRFLVKDGYLYGEYGGFFYTYTSSYFIYNIKTEELIEFDTKSSYNNFAQKNDLPKVNSLLSFHENYTNYWGGIRFFLLP